MALDEHALRLIAPFLIGARVLSLGYPDLIVHPNTARTVLKLRRQPALHTEPVHREYKLKYELPETTDTFMQAGAVDVTYVDRVAHRGQEMIADFNLPLPLMESAQRSFDLIIDPGSIEHAFNIGVTVRNAWQLLRVGGRIFHINPMTMVNHGFYNLNPTFYLDYATANGGVVEALKYAARCGGLQEARVYDRFAAPNNCSLYALIRKAEDVEWNTPIQWRYRK